MLLRLLTCTILFSAASFAAPPSLPHAATSFGATAAGGWIYLYGGNTGKAHEFHRDCINGDFFRWQVSGGESWQALPASTPLLGAPLVAHAGLIYRVGGLEARNARGEKDDLRSVATVMRFDPAGGAWEEFTPLPEPRSSHDVVFFDDSLFVGGGWLLGGAIEGKTPREGVWSRTLLRLNLQSPPAEWSSIPQLFQRRALAMVALGHRIWFLGGMDEEDQPSGAVDWFEPATGEWGKGPNLPDGPMRGFGMAACTVQGRLIASPVTGKLYALSDDGGRWEELGALQKPRFFHRLVSLGPESVVAFGGSGREGHVLEPEIISLAGGLAREIPAPTPVLSHEK